MTTSAIKIASIIRSAGTQFRANMDEDNVIAMVDLIERGVPFKTKIRLAEFEGRLYLTDGFHRLEAYGRLLHTEIPANQCVIVPASSIEEVRVMAMGANVAHGKGTTEADYYIIIKKMMELGDGKYMKNAFEADIKKIAEALGAAQPRVSDGYNNYFGTEGNKHPSLSQQCKERRDAAILEKHKEGMSARKIAELFKMDNATVSRALKELLQNRDSRKCNTPEVSIAAVPMASTEDRSETREDARSFIDEQLDALLDPGYIDMGDAPFSLTDDEADAPAARFDVLAATGYGEDLCQYTKPSQPANEYEKVEAAKANPVKLQERWMDLCDKRKAQEAKRAAILKMLAELESEMAVTDQEKVEVQRIATQGGIALPE
ncbi:helix-turn-helix domain-containing protein [Aeromonas caviae]|uniref:helix-turn-helix domain-containing protein n=1 Tax=Aeromonas caviae TaxID=648 RepID=UPI000AC403A1|nr:helix-turn-helix domain-containing protein [Aeromonas caviae]QOK20650.1 helix-turn-helix domain-containing protein [Aeromonas caviae]